MERTLIPQNFTGYLPTENQEGSNLLHSHNIYGFFKLIPVPRKIPAGSLIAKNKNKYLCFFLSMEVEAIFTLRAKNKR